MYRIKFLHICMWNEQQSIILCFRSMIYHCNLLIYNFFWEKLFITITADAIFVCVYRTKAALIALSEGRPRLLKSWFNAIKAARQNVQGSEIWIKSPKSLTFQIATFRSVHKYNWETGPSLCTVYWTRVIVLIILFFHLTIISPL